LSFLDDNGAALTLPLTSPQPAANLPADGPLEASVLERSLNANAQLVIESTGPDAAPVLSGSGLLQSNGGVSGFGIFSNPTQGWNAVVPLETRNASKYYLALDNTGELVTGVAVANLAATAANIAVIVRDDTGASLGTATIGLVAHGHTSFLLNQPPAGFPSTLGKRGTIEFDTPQGGRISVLGLRANGPALTTLPVLASGDTPGGTIAHVTYNGDFTSTFYIVNTGSAAANFTLSFFDESGNPLQAPLLLPQTSAMTTTSALTQPLAAGAMLVVRTISNAAVAGISGSAQLTTTGNISGFEIFQWTAMAAGQEASVPLETRTPTSFELVFDNTNGLVTGVALANVAATAVTVTARIYDDAGQLLHTAPINMVGRGHMSFLLADPNDPRSYPDFTANRRGLVEFVVPTGGKISVIGLRAKADGTLTTIPMLVK
jgi:hypothetical protein